MGACVTVSAPSFMRPAPERQWSPTLERAQMIASSGDVAQADSLLAQFASTYPGTPQARESYYWRAVLQLQSPNPTMGIGSTAGLLATYSADENADHLVEARIIREALLRVDSLSRASSAMTSKVQVSNGEVANATARAADAKADAKAASADTKDQDAEIRRLRDELAKSKEELDRIKKRLAEPTPKKPPTG
jgi:TolA-binding protein